MMELKTIEKWIGLLLFLYNDVTKEIPSWFFSISYLFGYINV